MQFPDELSDIIGPYYQRIEDGKPLIALAVKEVHLSPRGYCHGGIIFGMSDLQSLAASYMCGLTDRLTATVSFSMEFVYPAKLGDWLEMRTELIKKTKQFLFTQALIRNSAGDAIARSSGVFKLDPNVHPDPEIVTRLFR